MNLLKKLSIKLKVSLMLLLPALGFIYLSVLGIKVANQKHESYQSIEQLALLSQSISDLVHELQKERGYTAGYIGSKGTNFADTLTQQHKESNAKLNNYKTFVSQFYASQFSQSLEKTLIDIKSSLSKLEEIRVMVVDQKISDNECTAYYTPLNQQLLSVIGQMTHLSDEAKMNNDIGAYFNLLQAKERAGIERAILTNAFALGHFPKGDYTKYVSLVTEQEIYFKTFQLLASQKELTQFNKAMNHEAVKEVGLLRDIANTQPLKQLIITDLLPKMGLGGTVHNFKDYIIRSNEKHVTNFAEKSKQALALCDEYLKIPHLSDKDKLNLMIFRTNVNAYIEAMELAKEIKSGKGSIAEADEITLINDGDAITSLNRLLAGGDFDVKPARWWDASTKRMEQLRSLDISNIANILNKAKQLKVEAKQKINFTVIALVTVFLLSVLLVFIIVKNILSMVTKIKEATQTLASSSKAMSSISLQLLSGTNETKSQSESVASALTDMSSNINSMASSAEEMNVNVSSVSSSADQMSTNINSVASAIEEMSTTIKEVSSNAQKASKVSEKASAMSITASEKMKLLDRASQEIGKVTVTIKRFAEQTNLLALYATIEAASAGEAGKGFAVVAAEIKQLARQSAQAAEDITRKIEGIQNNTKEAVHFIENVTSIMGNINESFTAIAQAVAQQDQTTNEISRNVAESNEGAKGIAKSIAEISNGTNDLSKNVAQSAKGASQVSKSIQGVSKIAQEGQSNAEQVGKSATDLSKLASEISSLIDEFETGNSYKKVT
jgi:methyl-accepting chemotaxis protein